MRTVLNGPLSAEVDDLLARRRALGQDLYDEVWNGEYHVAPSANFQHGDVQWQLAEILGPLWRGAGLTPSLPFNIGTKDDFRVPDLGATRTRQSGVWIGDAAVVVEVVSPNDESYDKFDHYAEFGVVEVILVDPQVGTVEIFTRPDDSTVFTMTGRSRLVELDDATLHDAIDWP